MFDFAFFFKFLTAICLAWWFKREILLFATRINTQIYSEYHSLVSAKINYAEFEKESYLKVKDSKVAFLFYLFFPAFLCLNNNTILAIILITLCFLSLIDELYYLTDIRYVAIIFFMTLYNGNLDTLYITVFFFLFIHLFSSFILKKEGFGLGDSLLLIALSPLFSIENMLLLILIASVLGISYYLIEPLFTQRKREKLPFIPFISLATFIIIQLI
nr:prepilin peptidase [uncultured Haemophilus sp.]